MDFSLSEEQQAFRDSVRRWVDAEAPKSWARELERREEEYPFELWDKLTAGRFSWHRHRGGIRRPGRRHRHADAVRARTRTEPWAGLLWTWGLTSFAGGKSIGVYGTRRRRSRNFCR